MLSLRTWCCGALRCPPAIDFSPNPLLQSRSLFTTNRRSLALRRQTVCPAATFSSSVSCSATQSLLPEDPRALMVSPAMEQDHFAALYNAVNAFPPPPGVKFSYGTAGFRTDASLLKSVVFRAGVLAALRSLCTKQATGLMITASHNPVADNGVKLADPSGGMLTMEWEAYANKLANTNDSDSFLKVVHEIVDKETIYLRGSTGRVLLARDTRPSGVKLLAAAKKGVEAVVGVVAEDKGILTTPQLHWMVRAHNRFHVDTEEVYYVTLSSAFRILLALKPLKGMPIEPSTFNDGADGVGEPPAVLPADTVDVDEANTVLEPPNVMPIDTLVIDGANGVGARKLIDLQKNLGMLKLNIRNTGKEAGGILNFHVGADYVQKEQILPQNFDKTKDEGKRCVSIDGDADRLVYFYYGCDSKESTPGMHLLDGDKIMALFGSFIKEQVSALADVPYTGKKRVADGSKTAVVEYSSISVGAVQTAYANGASTRYLNEEVGVEVALTPTGVKYLHEKAEAYDIGLYFEANGHGTILLKEDFVLWLAQLIDTEILEGEKLKAVQRLLAISDMVNQATGDAMSGILLVELILHYKGWSVKDWDSIYEDVPSRQLKVSVADRSIITTTCAETKVSSPIELQEAIDKEIVKYKDGRSFVRPSGTEDIVRVYAEAADQDSADALARSVCALVYEHAGGVGPKPALQ